MSEFLATIVEHVRSQLEQRRREMPASTLRQRSLFQSPRRGFAKSLTGDSRRIIAEIKRDSPSKGLIRENCGPVAIDKDYAMHGTRYILDNTEGTLFQCRFV